VNRHADEMDRMGTLVRRGLIIVVALFCGFRFAIDWYNGPSVPWGFAITGLAALALCIVLKLRGSF